MSTRDFNFIIGPETSTLPTATTPTNDSDTITKGWLEQYGFTPSALHAPVQTVQNCKDIAAAERVDKMLLFVDDLESLFYFDSASSETGDDTTIIEPTSGTGRWKAISGGAGGGSSTVQQMLLAESIDTTTEPKGGVASQKNCLYVQAANSWLDINETGTEYPTQILTADAYFLIHDLGATLIQAGEAPYDLCDVVKTKLNANTNLTLTYNCTYSTTTRKITYSASSNFSILYNSGTHAGNMLNLGHTETSDKTGASSYTADNPIEDATEWTQRAFITQSDASYIVKSKNYRGLITTNGTKGQTATIRLGEQSGFNVTAGEKFYTKSARIVIESGINDALDWKIGAGAEINSTIPAGIYYRGVDSDPLGFRTLNDVLISTMEADSADNFTWVYDKNTEKFKCTDDSSNTIIFLFGTGTNIATSIATTIGWTAADTSAAITQTSVNRVEKAGRLGLATDTDVISSTVYAGFSSSPTHIVAEKCGEGYIPIVSTPHDWLVSPLSYDHSVEIQFRDMDFNSQGAGLKTFIEYSAGGSNAALRILYKASAGSPWTLATTSLSYALTTATLENFNNGADNFAYGGHCKIDENGHAVVTYTVWDGARWDAYVAYSTNLDTWTPVAISTGAGVSVFPSSLAMRENKCVVSVTGSTSGTATLYYADNIGSGYVSWSSAGTTYPFYYTSPNFVKIHYFANETGVAKYRIIFVGVHNPSGDMYYEYWQGDLSTGHGTGQVFGTTNSNPHSVAIDSFQGGNLISIIGSPGTGTGFSGGTLNQAESNTTYNGGVLTWNNHSIQNISSGNGVSAYTGNANEGEKHTLWNNTSNAVVYGDYAYHFIEEDANTGGKRAIMMYWTKNITSGTWETEYIVSNTGNVECVQASACYIPSSHSILLTWKEDSAAANALSEGQIYGRLAKINGDGSLTWGDITQVDGGVAQSTVAQKWQRCASSSDFAEVAYERYNGSTRDLLYHNVLR